MNARRFFQIGATTLVMAVSSLLHAAEGDAEWKKVSDAIQSLRTPEKKPASREEAIGLLKTGLKNFDESYAAAMKVAPNNPTKWDAALFEVLIADVRGVAEIPAPEKPAVTIAEILKAEDARPEVKSEASLVDVMQSLETASAEGGDTAAWVAKAEAHLKAFPAEKMNPMVAGKIKELKAAADLKTKPLELKFTAVDGREVDLSKLQGKVVLVDFWATWCGPCVAELPNVLKAYKELHPKGFEIVGISLDEDKDALEKFVKERGMEWPQYFDGKGWGNEISSKYGIGSIPAMWLVNKKGMVVSTNARDGLEEQVAKLLAE